MVVFRVDRRAVVGFARVFCGQGWQQAWIRLPLLLQQDPGCQSPRILQGQCQIRCRRPNIRRPSRQRSGPKELDLL